MSVPGEAAAILLVEDDGATRGSIATFLRGHGHEVREAADVATAIAAWDSRRPDLIILDLGLPDRDGLTVIRHVRREATTPVLVLSVRDRETDKVTALDRGADDYVTKPFGMTELRARIDALLRRSAGPAADAAGEIRIGELVVDVSRRLVSVHGAAVHLTPREYEVLKVLVMHRWSPGDPRTSAPCGLGHGIQRRGPLPPCLREPDPPQARCGRSGRLAREADRG